MFKKIILLILLLSVSVLGAKIQGKVYNFDLNPVDNAIVEVDSQRMVTQDGSYNFEIPEGEFTITAKIKPDTPDEEIRREKFTIKEGETKTLDLFLFPSTESDEELIGEIPDIEEEPLAEPKYEGPSLINYIILTIIVIIIIFVLRHRKNHNSKKKDNKEYIEGSSNAKLLKVLKDEDGRTTQKELRKRLGLSEAKVSMMVTELESEGKVKRIKKGRTNIVILNVD